MYLIIKIYFRKIILTPLKIILKPLLSHQMISFIAVMLTVLLSGQTARYGYGVITARVRWVTALPEAF